MSYARYSSPLLLIGILGLAVSAYAQQPADAAKSAASEPAKNEPAATPPAAEASANAATPAPQVNAVLTPPPPPPAPSADFMKKARIEGWRPKLKMGNYLFCKTDDNIGSHIPSEKCLNETELKDVFAREDYQRQQIQQRGGCSGGSGCSPTK